LRDLCNVKFFAGINKSSKNLQKCQSSHIYCNTKVCRTFLVWYFSEELIRYFLFFFDEDVSSDTKSQMVRAILSTEMMETKNLQKQTVVEWDSTKDRWLFNLYCNQKHQVIV